MKVLHLIPSISPSRGGPSHAVIEMTRALRANGIDAYIATTNDSGSQILPLQTGKWLDYEGVPVILFPKWNPKWNSLSALREFSIAPSLIRWLEKCIHEYQLIHFHALFSFPCTAGMAVARKHDVPYIIRTIGQLQHWSLTQSKWRKRILLKLIESQNLCHSAAVHFTSSLEQQQAERLHLTAPSFVLPLGVNLKPTPTQNTDSQSFLKDSSVRWLYLSRIHPKKQLPILLNAIARLKETWPNCNWQLDIAGDGNSDYVKKLQSLVNELGLTQNIYWHGFVAGRQKEELLQQADWFLLPSAAENFGIAAAESLAYGVPVLLTSGVALADIVAKSHAGVIAEPTVDSLCDALRRNCLQPPSIHCRQAARQLAETHFSWESISKKLITHYLSIIDEENNKRLCKC